MCFDIFMQSAEKRQVGFMSFVKESSLNPVLRAAFGEREA